MAKYIKVTHNDNSITSVGGFLTPNRSQKVNLISSKFNPKDFLDYSGDTPISNFQRIQRRIPLPNEKKINQDLYDQARYSEINLPFGTELFIPTQFIQREVLFRSDDNVIKSSTAKGFMASELLKLLKDSNYKPVIRFEDNDGALTTLDNKFSVFIWSRALSSEEDSLMQGSWFDASPFIQRVETRVSKEYGQFSLSLAPIKGIADPASGWRVDERSVKRFVNGEFASSTSMKDPLFFESILSENDLVFIRYEELGNDLNENFDTISHQNIPGKVYDMIGLIDRVIINKDDSVNEISIDVQGRDLMKIFIEDGSYFFPLQFAKDIFARNGSDLIEQRSLIDGSILTLSAYTERNILFTLQFIISHLSSTGLVPDSVFSGYDSEDLSRYYDLSLSDPSAAIDRLKKLGKFDPDKLYTSPSQLQDQLQPGIWQIIKLLVDPSVSNRAIVDSSIAQEQGSMINSIRKICQEPFVEFYGDTYGDRFVFQARQPPFNKIGMIGMIYDSNLESSNSNKLNDSRKGLIDKAINNARGELDSRSGEDKLSDIVIDIEESSLLNENLRYSEEAYSWYRIEPSALLFGQSSKFNLAYVPAISFDEYAKIYGSRVYSFQSNYIPYRPIEDEELAKRDAFLLRQVSEDFRFMIESTQYLPFTREGSITIHGDRRIKRGTFIRHKKTNEIYQVDEVVQNAEVMIDSTSRTTTLILSRGMLEPFIKGVEVQFGNETKTVSYFNIINTEIPSAPITDTEFLRNWKVDKDIFSFFVKRNQWKV